MHEDLNEIATLRFTKELESISSQTRDKVREMRNEYAVLTSSSGVRSGPQEAAIGRAQIEGSERLVHALYEIWVDLVKRRNGRISRPDVDFIAKKLEDFAQTQKGHLHQAFFSQRMGAVVNLLTEEAGQHMHAATANARRDLEIMAREHELFLRSPDASKQKASGAVPANEGGHPPHTLERPGPADQRRGHRPERDNAQGASERSIRGTIWKKIWSWVVVSVFVALALGLWGTFLTSGHPWAADMFFVVGAVTFLAKFLTWEDARQQPGARKKWLLGGMTILVLILTVLGLRWDHAINQVGSAPPLQRTPAAGIEAAQNSFAQAPGSSAPAESKPEEEPQKLGLSGAPGPTISVANRVKVVIAGHFLAVPADKLKPNDDFEENLGADPFDVSSLMDSLELEFGITIPSAERSNLHTVGETISYIEKEIQKKKEPPNLRYILESDFDEEVLRQTGPVLVFFCTESQAPCRVMAPTISSIAQEQRGKVKTVAVDVNINRNLPKKYDAGYFEVPVTILFSGGTEKGRIAGAASMDAVEHLISNPQAFRGEALSQELFDAAVLFYNGGTDPELFANEKPLTPSSYKSGLARFRLPKGNYVVKAVYSNRVCQVNLTVPMSNSNAIPADCRLR